MLAKPRAIAPGATLGIVAPSGPVPLESYERGLACLAARYRVVACGELTACHGYLAGTDEVRLAGLERALTEPSIDAVMMARGGYGLTRLLPRIDAAWIRACDKPVMGFSDGTALLAAFATYGRAALHGPVVTQLPRLSTDGLHAVFRAFESDGPGVLLDDLSLLTPARDERHAVAVPHIEGRLLGGNLEVFSRLMGTPFAPHTRAVSDCILFFEDIGEPPYKLDRLLTHLLMADVFHTNVRAVMFGSFTNCDPRALEGHADSLDALFVDRLGHLGIPLYRTAGFGHAAFNQPLGWGQPARIEWHDGKARLCALAGAVRDRKSDRLNG